MGLIIGLLLNTVLIAGLIVWLSKGDGAKWINTLNSNSLSAFVVLLVIMETAGAVNGMFVWAILNGRVRDLGESLGYLGIWFGFLGTHVFAISATLIGKRVTDSGYVEKKGAAKAAVAAATGTPGVVAGPVETMQVGVTAERPAVQSADAAPAHEWASGDPQDGVV